MRQDGCMLDSLAKIGHRHRSKESDIWSDGRVWHFRSSFPTSTCDGIAEWVNLHMYQWACLGEDRCVGEGSGWVWRVTEVSGILERTLMWEARWFALMILWSLDVRSSSFRRCFCAKGLWLSLCNIVWPGVHSLAVPFLILLLFCVAWRLCESTTPIYAESARQFWATIAATDRSRIAESSRIDNATLRWRGIPTSVHQTSGICHLVPHQAVLPNTHTTCSLETLSVPTREIQPSKLSRNFWCSHLSGNSK